MAGQMEISETKRSEQYHFDVSEVSLWLDSYDDIFSDFDPRPYSSRNVSDDFLNALRKAVSECQDSVHTLQLLMPPAGRKKEAEQVIAKRLHGFINKNQHLYYTKRQKDKQKNYGFVVSGAVLVMCAGMVSALKSGNIFMHLLLVMLEPTGWFLVWTGMDNLINGPKKEKDDVKFYNKLLKTKIVFADIIIKTN